MRQFSLPLLALIATPLAMPLAALADDIAVETKVSAATVYPLGATVHRAGAFEAAPGRHEIIVTDIPRGLNAESLRVSVKGAALGAVSFREYYVPPREEAESPALKAARAEIERLEDAIRAREDKQREVALQIEASEAVTDFLSEIGDVKADEGLGGATPESLGAIADMIGAKSLEALGQGHAASLEIEAIAREIEDLREELADARAAAEALLPRQAETTYLALSIDVPAQVQGAVEISYLTGAAGWAPMYDLYLTQGETNTLRFERGAGVMQGTGENWEDVALTLSTVQPSDQASPSEVYAWYRRIEEPRPAPVPSARKAIAEDMATGNFGSMAEPMVEPMIVIEEAAMAAPELLGYSVVYHYPEPVSITTDADSARLKLGALEMEPELSALAVPLFDETAFLMAELSNESGEVILPGQASLYLNGTFSASYHLDEIAAGDSADISFGPLEGLRLRRDVAARNEGDRGVISKSNEIEEEAVLEVRNLTGEAWELRLLDRVPVSEQEDLEITWSASPMPSAQNIDKKRGVLAWDMTIAPGATEQISLSHRIKWPEGMVLR